MAKLVVLVAQQLLVEHPHSIEDLPPEHAPAQAIGLNLSPGSAKRRRSAPEA
jgi:hypothetical protein